MTYQELAAARRILIAELERRRRISWMSNEPQAEIAAKRYLDKLNRWTLRALGRAMQPALRRSHPSKSERLAIELRAHPERSSSGTRSTHATRRPSRRRKSVQSLSGS